MLTVNAFEFNVVISKHLPNYRVVIRFELHLAIGYVGFAEQPDEPIDSKFATVGLYWFKDFIYFVNELFEMMGF